MVLWQRVVANELLDLLVGDLCIPTLAWREKRVLHDHTPCQDQHLLPRKYWSSCPSAQVANQAWKPEAPYEPIAG